MRAVGKGLIELGLEQFHTVAILGHNDPAWHIRSTFLFSLLVQYSVFLQQLGCNSCGWLLNWDIPDKHSSCLPVYRR